MTNSNFKARESAPACQLHMTGSETSYGILSKAAQSMSDRKLKALEDDISFYTQTGLIGVQMSSLLVLLRQDETAEAA